MPRSTMLSVLVVIMTGACGEENHGARSPAPAESSSDSRGDASDPAIVFVGDSLTAGHGLDPEQAYPALVQTKIAARGWRFRVVNAGVSGDTTSGGRSRLDWVLRGSIAVVVLALGGNDGLRGIDPELTRANLQAMIDLVKVKHPGAAIVIAGMQVPPTMGHDYAERFEKIFPELARANQVALIPFLLEGVGGHPDLNQQDGIHPTAAGQAILAENVWRVIEPMLR